ncbi:hypothetical protein IAI10_02555 [Clostridium sp. 19966]|uniref:hypothetical protein n=1 Tax=Clostridium sp. 19966 TaxID=2768166 RepID=UPI0028DF348D|nr:hypothetical protein [Clostridium sp. 19966]MDT8715540.1 hypothetical protein [Clostridium sp. 19966]
MDEEIKETTEKKCPYCGSADIEIMETSHKTIGFVWKYGCECKVCKKEFSFVDLNKNI